MDRDFEHELLSSDSDDDELNRQIAEDNYKYRNGRPAENICIEIHVDAPPVDH